jgi:uncharacterized cupredoxin-like copper-binding protein
MCNETGTVNKKEEKMKLTDRLNLIVYLALIMVFTAACSGMSVRKSSEIVKSADWDTMQTVTVKMNEFEYMPEDLVLKAGQPYKLELINIGKKKHYYTAPEFFKSIATRKVQSNKDGEIKAPYFLALEMMADGGQLDLYFVPVKKGVFPVICTIDDHQDQGMEGTITVE